MEPQLMITAGPAMGIPPQYAQNYAAAAAAPGYAPNMAYPPGYGMQAFFLYGLKIKKNHLF